MEKHYRLNLGCACMLLPPPWHNLDIASQDVGPGYVFKQHDLRKVLPYEDESVELIYCSHMLDHIPLSAATSFLKECHRVMVPGAVGRFVVMNFELLMDAWNDDEVWRFGDWQPKGWKGLRSKALRFSTFMMGSLSDEEEYSGHWWSADYAGLREMCQHAGFTNVQKSEYGKSQSKAIMLETKDGFPDHSLFVEVVK
jgi:predicted SAM-dependent methyltransferase